MLFESIFSFNFKASPQISTRVSSLLPIGSLTISLYWSNSFFVARYFSFSKVSSFIFTSPRFKVASIDFNTSFLLAFCECSSNTKSPKPTFSKRVLTTSRAAIFSDTNKIDL